MMNPTIYQTLEFQANRISDAAAIVAPDRPSLTYKDLCLHIERTVKTLNAMGLGRNDRVAIVLPNGPEMATTFLAVAAGATSAPLNPAYRANEFNFYFSDLQAKALIIQSGMDSPAISVAQSLNIPVIKLRPTLEAGAGIFELTGDKNSPSDQDGFAQPDDVALVLHTSGTTSRPKIVPLTQTNICTSAHNIQSTLKLTQSDRCLNVMPLFHIHGLMAAVLSSLAAGGSIVCTPGFDSSKFYSWIEAFKPTWYTAVPTMHQAVLARAQDNREIIAHNPLRFIRSSSASLPPQVMSALENTFDVPVIEAYGMTEASHQMTSNPLPPHQRKVGSVGVAAGPKVAIMDEVGNLLSPGEVGEIVICGVNVTLGYDNNPGANEKAFTHDWFRTGDQGYFDNDGYLFISGRLKEIINRGGQKITPREVDEVFLEHEAVAQAVAFAVPHPTLGEDVAAAVVLQNGSTVTEKDLRDFAFAKLADYKVPSQVVIVTEIPKGPTGKLQRIGLAEKLTSEMRVEFVTPRDSLENDLANIWSDVLGVDRLGIQDNFFALGGDSLLAARLFVRIEQKIGKKLPLTTLFRAPTIEQFANILRQKGSLASPPATKRMRDTFGVGLKNRLLQLVALYIPGFRTARVWLHRMRGVKIGQNVSIGTAVIIESAYPKLVSIGDNVSISVRTTIIAHFKESVDKAKANNEASVRIGDDAYIGPGVIILPNVTIGQGAVVAAGSVVTKSVSPQTMVQGNPAEPVAECGVPLTREISYEEFLHNLKPIKK